MWRQLLGVIIVFLIIYPINAIDTLNTSNWWDDRWSYREEIEIPIDTSKEEAKFQPIDIHIVFDNSCWAVNETYNSIRVICEDDNGFHELESQVYDLNHIDDHHIDSCGLVFLIPDFATGKERYYVYYDDNEKPANNYIDHVSVKESYYRYEPIPGYPFESKYFKITQHGYIIYGVAYQGEFLGFSTAHQITKFKGNTVDVSSPKNAETWASFDFFYYYRDDVSKFSSTIQTLLSKEILIDGNLMVRFKIRSTTARKDVETAAIYTYYYCPTIDKKIFVYVKHKALEELHIGMETDVGNICGLQAGSMRSPSIEDLNFGRMYPYFHVYAEDGSIKEYTLDLNPEYTPNGIPVLTVKDDVDLGKHAWASFDDGEEGEAHAIIFASNTNITKGSDERDGIQVEALEGSTPGVLGLETDLISFYFSRNAYEKGSTVDLVIPSDFTVEYDAEFFSGYKNGYHAVDREAKLFQSLGPLRIITEKPTKIKEREEKTYAAKIFVHLASSAPMGIPLSLLTGRNFSYITVELYRKDKFVASDTAERLSIRSISTKGLLPHIFDWRNLSIFKKVVFHDIKPGVYLVKVYRNNPLLGGGRKFIGFKIIEVKENISTHIFCTIEGSIHIKLVDQKGKPIDKGEIKILYDNTTIVRGYTNENGEITFKIPVIGKPYTIFVIEKNILTYSSDIRLRFLHSKIDETIETSIYPFNLTITDTWGLPPDYTLTVWLTSDEMISSYSIYPYNKSEGCYIFKALPSAEYILNIRYKSFSVEREIKIPCENLNIRFPAEYNISVNISDRRGLPISDFKLVFIRKNLSKTFDKNKVSIPPGRYLLKIYEDQIIGERHITIVESRSIDILADKPSTLPIIFLSISLLFITLGFLNLKKKKKLALDLFSLSLIVFSMMYPWWMLNGVSNDSLKITTEIYIMPPSIISFYSAPDIICGEQVNLPENISLLLYVFPILLIISGVLLIINNYITRRRIKILLRLLPIILLILTIVLFYYGFSKITSISVGSFIGTGIYQTRIPGEEINYNIQAKWGLGWGLISCIASLSLIVISQVIQYSKKI